MRRLLGPVRLGLGLLLLASGGFFFATPGASPAIVAAAFAPDDRPNIVLISTDDQTVQDLRWMPKTKALLAAQGVTFQGISPHPLCCPARAEILTGQYAHNNGVYSNAGKYGGYQALSHPDNTIGAWLKDAGYRTGFSGKFLNGYSWEQHGRPAGWDFWDPTVLGTYAYTGYTTANNGVPRPAPPGEYITDYVAQVTREHIELWSNQSRPFFFWASYVAPHTKCDEAKESCHRPPIPAEQYASAYPTAVNPATAKPSFNERDVTDKPKRVRGPKRDRAKLQRLFLQRIRTLVSVDDAVENTVQALAESGELQNTVIIFTSDNGYLLGEHRLRGKKASLRGGDTRPADRAWPRLRGRHRLAATGEHPRHRAHPALRGRSDPGTADRRCPADRFTGKRDRRRTRHPLDPVRHGGPFRSHAIVGLAGGP